MDYLSPTPIPSVTQAVPPDGAGPTDVAARRRLSAPGLRAFVALAQAWSLTEDQRLALLGQPSRSTYYNWVRTAQSDGRLTLPLDTMLRISALLGIAKALRILFPTDAAALAWLRDPHAAPVFGGAPPLALITAGTQDALLTTRRFLDAARGGRYMPAGAGGVAEGEIVLV